MLILHMGYRNRHSQMSMNRFIVDKRWGRVFSYLYPNKTALTRPQDHPHQSPTDSIKNSFEDIPSVVL